MENFRVREPSVLKSVRFVREQWEKIVEYGESENCKDFTDALRKLVDSGLWLEEHKKQLQDPEKNRELIDEYNKRMEDETIFDWLGTQSKFQLEGLDAAIKLEKEKRFS